MLSVPPAAFCGGGERDAKWLADSPVLLPIATKIDPQTARSRLTQAD
jgi:hypothetical protein